MKNKILSLMLAIALAIGVFSGVCFITANAEGLPNLLELYGYQPGFEEGSGPWTNNNAKYTRTEDLSHDDDGYVFAVSKRETANDGPQFTVTAAKAGTYYYSYYVKTFDLKTTLMMGVRFVVGGTTYLGGRTNVKSDTWTMIAGTVDLTAGQQVTLGIHQFDFDAASNNPDIIVDDVVFAEFTATNLLQDKNYDFESWTWSLTTGRKLNTWLIASADASRESTNVYSGTYSVKVTNRGERWSGPHYEGTTSEFYVGPGKYYYSFYAKCVNKNDACKLASQILIKAADFDGTAETGTWLSSPNFDITGSGWTKVEGFIDVPATATKEYGQEIAKIRLQLSQPLEEQDAICSGIYFDYAVFASPLDYSIGTNLLSEANASVDNATKRVSVTANSGDYFMFVANRTVSYGLPAVSSAYAKTIFEEQGTGTYTFSFDVKCLFPTDVARMASTIEIKAKEKNESGSVYAQYLNNGFTNVTGVEWQTITAVINVPDKVNGSYEIAQIAFRPAQKGPNENQEPAEGEFNINNPTELLFDNFCLTKEDYVGDVENIFTSTERKPYSEVKRPQRTGVGAIYYNMWFESLDNWWEQPDEKAFWNYATSNDYNSTQEARSLSVAQYQFHLPFFATINTEITESACTRGDLSKGVAEFPALTEQVWTQEMEYAIDAGIDFMAYLWARNDRPKDAYESAFQYHIKTRGLNNRIKMCAILQAENQDLDTMALAMTENYWYTIDGMPVVYIYGGNSVATEMFVKLIRHKLAVAQKVKYGAVGVPAYIIVMGNNTYEQAQVAETLGVDATGWYGTGTGASIATTSPEYDQMIAANKKEGLSYLYTQVIERTDEYETYTKELTALKGVNDPADKPSIIRVIKYSAAARNNINTIKKVAPIAKNGNISVTPIITLGYSTEPRILNPVSWNGVEANSNKISNSATTGELPTADEITENVLNVLNLNKENAATFNANTVLIYAWNEFNEGGWICPNIKLDANGKVVEGEVDRTNLDAVKAGIALYREHELENKTYDVNGNVVTENIDIPVYTENTIKINVKGSIDAIDLSAVTITANGKKVTPVVDAVAGTLTCTVEKNSTMTLNFNQMGIYTPISIQYAGVKGHILGTNEYSFTAYGNFTEFDVSYAEVEGELKTVTMFYVNASGTRVVFDNFVVDGDVVEKINNYPKLYKKAFKAFNVNGTICKTAEDVAALIVGEQTEIEVEYVDTAAASIEGFAVAKHENMTVTVNGQEAPAKVEPFVLATFTADEQKDGQAFSYWADENGQPVSYNRVYTRYITGDVDIKPVYGKAAEQVAITVTVADNEEKLVLIAERSLSKDYQILEHGIIIAEYNDPSLTLDSVGENERGKVYLGHRIDNGGNVLNNGTYILTKGDKHSLGGAYSEKGTTLTFVAYVRYLDSEGNEQIKYSAVGTSNVEKAEAGPSIDFDEIA